MQHLTKDNLTTKALARRAATKRKNFDHEAHEEHEGRKHFFEIRSPLRYTIFVSFATFVVRKSLSNGASVIIDLPKKFAQAAKTFNYSSTKDSDIFDYKLRALRALRGEIY